MAYNFFFFFKHRFNTRLTVIVSFAQQLQKPEEVTGELIVRHHFLTYDKKNNKL